MAKARCAVPAKHDNSNTGLSSSRVEHVEPEQASNGFIFTPAASAASRQHALRLATLAHHPRPPSVTMAGQSEPRRHK